MSFAREHGGEPIPGYKLIERLGGGGFGEVWKVEAPGGMHKAIKFVYGDLQTANEEGQRAEQELKAIKRVITVRHPYILSLERYDIKDGQLMIVMELADRNLWDRFRECKAQNLPGIPRDELMRYMEESAEALDLMNMQYQLQHLDIKPQNIFLIHNHIKVADFGLVKDLEGMVASVTGGVTPVYAAPETFDGMVTRFCDQYSLAIVYQELLTGQRPFAGTNIHQLVMQHVQGKPNLSPLSAADQEVIGRSLSKNPDDRYPSCAEMVQGLRAAGAPRTPKTDPEPPVIAPTVPEPAIDRSLRDEQAETLSRGEKTPAPVKIPEVEMIPLPQSSVMRSSLEPVLDRLKSPSASEKTAAAAEASNRPEPPEVSGDGELMPAMVIGIGQMGLGVLQQLREILKERFGGSDAFPHLRLLGIDTDAEALHRPPPNGRGSPLSSEEAVAAKLNRAFHYMKPREGRPRLDPWFNSKMLYRIQRDLTTGGLRALGRLAFIDNYRAIAQRIRSDLETCVAPDNLTVAAKKTGLKVRTNRPRVYVVTSLGGGTGSGMFIDTAYAVRSYLKQLGYSKPDVVGLLLLPPVEKETGEQTALLNAYTSLLELNHFSSKGVTFTGRFDDREGTITDAGPPFERCFLLPLPSVNDAAGTWKILGVGADFLFRNLATPLGRAADEARASLAPPASENLACQTFGLTRFWFPKRAVQMRVSRQFCRQLVHRWASKETLQREMVQNWVKQQWTEKELDADLQIARMQAACEKVVGKSPEAAFNAINEPFVPRMWRGVNLTVNNVREAVDKIIKLLGQPSASSVLQRVGQLEETLRQESEVLLAEWEQKLLPLTANLLEQPEFRLAGAEEAIRSLMGQMEKSQKHYEPLIQELNQKATSGHDRLQVLLQNLDEIVAGGSRVKPYAAELVELLRNHPRNRYQSLVVKFVHNSFTALRSRLADQLREIGFVRTRLGELHRAFEIADSVEQTGGGPADANQLLPAGCKTLDEAVARFVARVKPEEIEELDRRVNNLIRQQFRGLVNVCTTSATLLKKLEVAMLEEALAFTAPRQVGHDVVEMFLARYSREGDARTALGRAFDQAAPTLLGRDAASRTEITILAAPASPREREFRQLARQAVPESEMVPAPSPEDIVIYREEMNLMVDQLAHVGELGQDAYRQTNMAENYTPHTRTDILDWRNIALR